MGKVAKYDPGNVNAFIYMWGTTGLGYNVDKVKERMPEAPVDSGPCCSIQPTLQSSPMRNHGPDSPTDVIPSALRYLGEDPDSKDPAVIEKGVALLEKVRPYIRKSPQLGKPERSGQWRHLPLADVLRRRRHRQDQGGGGQQRRQHRVFDPRRKGRSSGST